ncbi:MAG: 23S rRNA (pseudouridine(1915)-N(3))-methyltransferase RlmH [Clostridia bacterium]|nr:23S rRNA (pseudouridine(1915)-N(3))-methyltransferase RlmH [Clostridia bacterium]MBR6787575.1 23S rRNA (pseudouridine(1915)-N(3))-methyltransferase RlmH [Clostridia bacterium]
MQPVVIIGVGRLREKFFRDAAEEYKKRLSRYVKLDIIEVDDLPEDGGDMTKKKEGEMILSKIRPDDFVVANCIDGKQMDSVELSEFFREREMYGSRVVFVIGGSLGLSDEVIRRANKKLSMSKMTFPHQLFRVMLLEQIYRAQKILSGERYHK